MQGFIQQLRAITHRDASPTSTALAVGNSLGGPVHDNGVFGGSPEGPFATEEEFSSILRYSDDPGRQGHDVVFTHADLNPRNILISLYNLRDGTRGWRVSGIVDWEFAGFYPEYWDYTESLFEGFRWSKRLCDLFHGIFMGIKDYSKEFDVEKRAWESGDGV